MREIVSMLEENTPEEEFYRYLAVVRWSGMPDCRKCGQNTKYYWVKKRKNFRCCRCKKEFSATAGTMMHATRLPVKTWFRAMVIILSSKKGVSSLQLARILQVNKNTGWYLQYRIRAGMNTDEVTQILNRKYGDLFVQVGRKRRHRNRLRPKKNAFSRSNEQRYLRPSPETKNISHMFRALAGQYHHLGEFHYRSYDLEITFKRTYYPPMIFNSLIVGLCCIE